MAEYIEREDVREMMRMEFDDDYADEAVDRLPTADVAPVRHGEWIDVEDDYGSYLRCSICGDEFTSWEADCARTNYCPNCGAKMEGGSDE